MTTHPHQNQETSTPKPIINILLLILLIGGTIISRYYYFNQAQYSNDELCIISIANGFSSVNHQHLCISLVEMDSVFTNQEFKARQTLDNVFQATLSDNGNGLVNNFLLYGLSRLWGNEHQVVYVFLLFLHLFCLLILYQIARTFLSVQAALLVLILFSLNPYICAYNFIARGYFLSIFFTLFATYLYLQIIDQSARWGYYLFYSISGLLAVFTHFLTIGLLFGHGLYALFSINRQNWRQRMVLIGILLVFPLSILAYFYAFPIIMEVLNCQTAVYQFRALHPEIYNNYPVALSLKSYIASILQFLEPSFGIYSAVQIRYLIPIMAPQIALILLFCRELIFQRKIIALPSAFKVLLTSFVAMLLLTSIIALQNQHNLIFQEHYSLTIVFISHTLLIYAIFFISKTSKRLQIVSHIGLLFITVAFMYAHYCLQQQLKNQQASQTNYELVARNIEMQYTQGNTVVFKSADDAQCVNLFFSKQKLIYQTVDTSIHQMYVFK